MEIARKTLSKVQPRRHDHAGGRLRRRAQRRRLRAGRAGVDLQQRRLRLAACATAATCPAHKPADYAGGCIQAVDLDSGAVEVVYTHCGEHQLKGPNDLVFDDAGGFWFTDPGKARARDRDIGALYYAKADGSEIRQISLRAWRPPTASACRPTAPPSTWP